MKRLAIIIGILAALPGFAHSAIKEGEIISKTAIPIDFNKDITFEGVERFSMQAVYSTSTPSSETLNTGAKSTGQILVADWTLIRGVASTATFTIPAGKNTSAILTGVVLTINGKQYVGGTDWAVGVTSTETAKNLATAADAYPEYHAVASSNVVIITAASTGTYANSWFLTTSTGAAFSVNGATSPTTANFSGGREYGYININGTTLTEGTDFLANTSSGTTAKNVSNAIVANATLSQIVISSHTIGTPNGIVYATAAVAGLNNYYVSASEGFTAPGTLTGGATPDFTVAGDSITKTSHGYETGLAVRITTTAPNALPNGFIHSTTYYVIRLDSDTYKLATTTDNAVAGTAVDFTSMVDNSTVTVAPLAFVTGNASFKWQASNDGANWADLSVSSGSVAASNGSGNIVWDFAQYAYKYLRMRFVGPTSGGVNLTIRQYGKDK